MQLPSESSESSSLLSVVALCLKSPCLKYMFCMRADEPVHQSADFAHEQKENVEPSEEQSSSVQSRQPTAVAALTRQPRRSSNSKSANTKRGKQSTDTARSSVSASDTAPHFTAPHDLSASLACESGAQDPADLASASQVLAPRQAADTSRDASTPVMAQQPKASSDLDKLLGSKRKPSQPQRAVEAQTAAAESPIAALRSQLRQVKLESSPARGVQGFADSHSGCEGQEATAGRQTVALRQVKREPVTKAADTADPNLTSGSGRPEKVSALKGFWETQSGK